MYRTRLTRNNTQPSNDVIKTCDLMQAICPCSNLLRGSVDIDIVLL